MPNTCTSAILVALRAALNQGATYSSLAEHAGVDRRTLSRLDNGEDVELRVSQLEALHAAFAKLGFPLLRHPTLSAALTSGEEVRLLIPAYRDHKDPHRRLCSPWDVLAADRIRGPLQRVAPAVRTHLLRVAHEEPLTLPSDSAEPRGHVLCIGSPRATAAFDSVARRITEWTSDAGPDEIRVPVRFYWKNRPPRSPFVVMPDELPRKWTTNPAFAMARAALVFDEDDPLARGTPPLLEITNLNDPSRNSFESYGLILARRMPNGCIWACIGGLTGPATEAAARAFLDLPFSVPPPPRSTVRDPAAAPARDSSASAAVALYVIRAAIDVNVGQTGHADDDLRSVRPDSIELVPLPWPQPRYLTP